MAQGGGQAGGMGGSPMGGQLGGNPMGGQQRMMPPPTPQMGGQLGGMNPMGGQPKNPMGGMGGMGGDPMGSRNPMGGQLGGMGGDPMDRQMYGVQQFQPRNQQGTDIMDMYPTYGGMRGDPMGSRNPMGGQLGGMGPMGGQLNPDFMQQMYGLPQQGMGGFNQGPKTENDWNNYAAQVQFTSGTDMEKAKADYLAQGNQMPFNPMQQLQQGMGGFNQGPKTENDWNNYAAQVQFTSGTDMEKAKAAFLAQPYQPPPFNQQNMQQPAGIAGLQGLLGGMPNQSTPTAQPAPVAARPAPISVVPPNTPPAVASAIQKLAGRQARRR